ncbi:MAG: hypothetical protein KAV87_32295, partial [Desulfobacteraceae bacterium]|nr:hypothetical protein [Desulfobacteraceae bacterium]
CKESGKIIMNNFFIIRSHKKIPPHCGLHIPCRLPFSKVTVLTGLFQDQGKHPTVKEEFVQYIIAKRIHLISVADSLLRC